MRDLRDDQLVLLVQGAKDEHAYEELVRRHYRALLSFLSAAAEDTGTAEDAAQRAMFKAYRKIDQFDGRSSFKTWLFTIGYREWVQIVRKRIPVPVDELPESIGDAPFDASMDLQQALDRLAGPERIALLLCDGYGMSHREASRAMAAPLGSVKTLVRRARTRMRKILGDHSDE
ncbi:MAG: RNA polymerase sigma factor [Myxococcota bacterium]